MGPIFGVVYYMIGSEGENVVGRTVYGWQGLTSFKTKKAGHLSSRNYCRFQGSKITTSGFMNEARVLGLS